MNQGARLHAEAGVAVFQTLFQGFRVYGFRVLLLHGVQKGLHGSYKVFGVSEKFFLLYEGSWDVGACVTPSRSSRGNIFPGATESLHPGSRSSATKDRFQRLALLRVFIEPFHMLCFGAWR